MNIKAISLVVVLGISLSGCSSSNESVEPLPTEESVVEDLNWAPVGYKYFDRINDSQTDVHDVAYLPDHNIEVKGGTAFGFLVMAQNGCSSLYIEANLTVDGIVEGWANASTSSLAPFQEARMLLQWSHDEVGEVEWTEVSCIP